MTSFAASARALAVAVLAGASLSPALQGQGPDITPAPVADVTRAPGELPAGELRLASALRTSGFITEQLRFGRVQNAMDSKRAGLEEDFRALGLAFPPQGVYVRVFKAEREVEVWVRGKGHERYVRLRRYPICQVSGALGPKRQEGDRQIPEGFYEIEAFNPQSEFHLSLRVNYPNTSDRRLGRSARLGGDIYLHGGCSTVGCVPVTDDHIRELYWLSVEARAAGLRRIPVHIFPTRMDAIGMAWLQPFGATRGDLRPFWEQLREGYAFFERHRRVPGVIVEGNGSYSIVDAGSPEGFSRQVRPARRSQALLGAPADEATAAQGKEAATTDAPNALPVPELTGREAALARSEALLGDPVDAAPPRGAVAAEASREEHDAGPRLLGEAVVVAPGDADEGDGGGDGNGAGGEGDVEVAAGSEAGEWLTEEDLGEPRPALLGSPLILGREIEGGAAPPASGPITIPGFEVREAEAIPGNMPYRPPRITIVRPVL